MSEEKVENVKHATLAAALVAAQREAEGPKSDGDFTARGSSQSRNPGQSYGYAYPKPETAIPHLRACLNRHGLAVRPGRSKDAEKAPVLQPYTVPGVDNDTFIPIDFTLVHEGGEERWWPVWAPVCLPFGKTRMAGWKYTATGVDKYVYMQILGVRGENDDDEGAVPTASGRAREEGPPPPVLSAPAPPAQAAPPRPPSPPPVPSAPPAPAASSTAPPATSSAPPAPAPTAGPSDLEQFEAIEEANRKVRVEKMHAAARATGMPGLAVTQYVLEVVMSGEEVDLMDPAPLHAQKITTALEALARAPLPAAEVAALALRRESFLSALAEERASPAPAPSAPGAPTTPASASPAPAPQSAPPAASPRSATPAPPAIQGNAATDQRLAGRFSVFMKRASDERKARGVPNADEEYLNRINAWALVPGLTSFATPIAETERRVTAAVMDRLEAGLEAWIAERQPVGAGK